MIRKANREPDFENMRLVLQKKIPHRPVLFDFIIGTEKKKMLVGIDYRDDTEFNRLITAIKAFDSAGYDFTPLIVSGMEFPRHYQAMGEAKTKSLNSEAIITDWESFNNYKWPDVKNADFSILTRAGKYLPGKSKFMPYSYDGILENIIGIIGFNNLCYMIYDDPELMGRICFEVGKRIEEYFTECLKYDEVGAIICNDDWGFNSQTMISPELLRKHVFPWYKKIVQKAHDAGKFALLHSCGYYYDIIDDIIDDMKFDGRQSYEDKIVPVEKAYSELYPRLAVIGGIDMNFLVRSSSQEVTKRCQNMLKMAKDQGGYALGSGNSIPDFVPDENYLALLKAGMEE